jgi:hypothetical protein
MNQKTAKNIRRLINMTFQDLEDVDYEYKEKIIFSRDMKNSVVHKKQKLSKNCKRYKEKVMKKRWREQYE